MILLLLAASKKYFSFFMRMQLFSGGKHELCWNSEKKYGLFLSQTFFFCLSAPAAGASIAAASFCCMQSWSYFFALIILNCKPASLSDTDSPYSLSFLFSLFWQTGTFSFINVNSHLLSWLWTWEFIRQSETLTPQILFISFFLLHFPLCSTFTLFSGFILYLAHFAQKGKIRNEEISFSVCFSCLLSTWLKLFFRCLSHTYPFLVNTTRKPDHVMRFPFHILWGSLNANFRGFNNIFFCLIIFLNSKRLIIMMLYKCCLSWLFQRGFAIFCINPQTSLLSLCIISLSTTWHLILADAYFSSTTTNYLTRVLSWLALPPPPTTQGPTLRQS